MKKQLMTKSYALLWFYDIFFCHQNPLEMDDYTHDVDAIQEELEADPWDRKHPDMDEDEVEEYYTKYFTRDYRPKFAQKAGKTLREIRLYEKQIRAFQYWSPQKEGGVGSQPWYYALLDLFTQLFNHHEVRKADFLALYSMNERTFKRYLHTIRDYEKGRGEYEFAVAYDAKAKIYKSVPTGIRCPISKLSGCKAW